MQLHVVPIAKPGWTSTSSSATRTSSRRWRICTRPSVQTNPNMLFGIAFCEASGPALVRWVGNDTEMIEAGEDERPCHRERVTPSSSS